jgi:hypothetical protein
MSRATVIETHEHKREFKEPHFSIRALIAGWQMIRP